VTLSGQYVRVTARGRALVALLGGLVAAACGGEEPASSDVGRACDLLSTKTEVTFPPPATGTRTVAISEIITERAPDPAVDALVFVPPDRTSELEEVAEDVGEVPGIEVVGVRDQDQAYDEFVRIFAGQEELIEMVTPEVLPAEVRVTVDSAAAFEALNAAFSGDPRIYRIVDGYEVTAGQIEEVARRFAEEFEELERITDGEMRDAIALIRSEEGPTREELPGALAAVGDFLGRECNESSE
jgi:hypothetical protein